MFWYLENSFRVGQDSARIGGATGGALVVDAGGLWRALVLRVVFADDVLGVRSARSRTRRPT